MDFNKNISISSISIEDNTPMISPTLPIYSERINQNYQASSIFNSSEMSNQMSNFNICQNNAIILNKKEEDFQEKQNDSKAIASSDQKQPNTALKPFKAQPFTISRRANNHFRVNRVVNYAELFMKNIGDIDCFMLAGDFTVDKFLFQKLNQNSKEAYCPLHNYRPQVAVQAGRNYVICTLNQSYNGITDVIAPVQMLRLLQNQAAFEVSSFIQNYSNYIAQLSLIRHNLNKQLNLADLVEQIKQNHIDSLKIANEAMEKADKNKAYVFLYMKFDFEACTNKLYFVGGNSKFSQVFLGENDINLMRQYCQRYSFPHFNDVSGVLNVLYSKFQCKNSYNSNLVTFDDETIPFEGIREYVPLKQLEIAPGLSVGDKFEMRELKINTKIFENIENQRKSTNQIETYLRIDDLGYTLEAEAFVQKFYQKSKKAKTNPPSSNSSCHSSFSVKSSQL